MIDEGSLWCDAVTQLIIGGVESNPGPTPDPNASSTSSGRPLIRIPTAKVSESLHASVPEWLKVSRGHECTCPRVSALFCTGDMKHPLRVDLIRTVDRT
jgi:hypothetical protein